MVLCGQYAVLGINLGSVVYKTCSISLAPVLLSLKTLLESGEIVQGDVALALHVTNAINPSTTCFPM